MNGNLSLLPLSTKPHLTPVRAVLVSRPRLFERLNGRLCHKPTLVSVTHGFGTTTWLSGWMANSGRAVARLSLEEDDSKPARFLHTVGQRDSHSGTSVANSMWQSPPRNAL